MATIEELVVRAKPEGLDETVGGFENMQEELEETEQQMDDTTGGLSDLANKWKGAMGAIVAGLAVATAGLASKIPVIGEVASGLGAVISGLAFQMDKALRPSLQGVTNELFNLANEVYRSDGVLDALDAIASKAGSLGLDAIEFTLEGDKLKAGTEEIVEFVFPKIGQGPILEQVFSFDLSAAAVITALFGTVVITASKVLTFLLPASITATSILTFMLPVIGTAAVLSHLFGFDMTKLAVLGAIFGGVALTGAGIISYVFGGITIGGTLVLSSITWPVIAGAAIIGVLFAGVAITSAMVLNAIIDEDAPAAVTGDNRELSPELETGFVDPRKIPGLKQTFEAGQETGKFLQDNVSINIGKQTVRLDGRDVTQETGKYRGNETALRGVFD